MQDTPTTELLMLVKRSCGNVKHICFWHASIGVKIPIQAS